MSNINQESSNFAQQLSQNRIYAFNSEALSSEELADACADSFDSFGFCVIDNVIPTEAVSAIRQEVLEAQKKVSKNIQVIKELVDSKRFSEDELLKNELYVEVEKNKYSAELILKPLKSSNYKTI